MKLKRKTCDKYVRNEHDTVQVSEVPHARFGRNKQNCCESEIRRNK